MSQIKNPENKSGWLIGGGVLASITTAICCIGPLVLTILGVSGAAVLAKFEIIRVPMIIIVVALFGAAGFYLFRKKDVCEPGSICADPKKYKNMVRAYWIGLVLAILGIFSPYWVTWFF
ncbi:MAG: mercury transporter [Bdellovibrionaceae bacterium]|nr:mercury transporter [Pseudobdellovibrionaceae bacterium]|tara:strand:- start:349 stop:705 length:357 start_codon:yes stop_codon:yes gene_type:complete